MPLLWEKGFCWKTPIALGYTRGHFSALVTMEMDTDGILGAGAHIEPNDDDEVAYLPLVDYEGKLLPVPFLMGSEVRHFENVCTKKCYKAITRNTDSFSCSLFIIQIVFKIVLFISKYTFILQQDKYFNF